MLTVPLNSKPTNHTLVVKSILPGAVDNYEIRFILSENIYYGSSLKPPLHGSSNKYPRYKFLSLQC